MSNELQTQENEMKPNYLSEIPKDSWGTDDLQQYISPSYVKITQKQSSEPYSNYEVGTVLAVPQNIELFRPNQEFHITPVFFYTEFILANPYVLSNLSFIRERSFDSNGELAKHARDFNNRTVPCPEAPAGKEQQDKYQCTYFEHLNFLCLIEEHETFCELPIVFTFRSGEFKTGKNLANLIALRRGPLYACRFKCYSEAHKQGSESNYGFTISNPSEGSPWLVEERFNLTKELHAQFKELHAKNLIQVAYADEPAGDGTSAETPEM